MRLSPRLIFVIAITGSLCRAVPVLTVEQGRERLVDVPREKYSRGLSRIIEGSFEEISPALERSQPKGGWKLSSVTLGVGVSLTGGFFPFFQQGVAPRFRMTLKHHLPKPPKPVEEVRAVPFFHSSLDELLWANADALEQAEPGSRRKWNVDTYETELSFYRQGILAAASLQGTSTATLTWRKNKPPKEGSPERPPSERPVVEIDEETSWESFREELEPVVDLAVATGGVKDRARFRNHLFQRAAMFYEQARAIPTTPGAHWWISGYASTLSLSGSVTLPTGLMPGVSFSVSLNWKRLRHGAGHTAPPPDGLSAKFRKFVLDLAHDIQSISYTSLLPPGYYPSGMTVGIGWGAGLEIGIASLSGSDSSSLSFSTDTKPPAVNELTPPSPEPIAVWGPNGSRGIILQLEHAQLRKGFRRAVKLAGRLAARTARVNKRKWHIYKVSPYFSLTQNGLLNWVAPTAFGSISMDFTNGKF